MKRFLFILLAWASFLGGYEVAIVSMFRNTAPYLKEWIEYHHMIGVDHFWLYNDASTDNWEEVLMPYIEEGLVEVFYWPAGKPDWVPSQMAAFQDGIKRAHGVATWVALIDQDEFILPMKDRSLTECLQKHFKKESAIYLNWRNFGTSGITLKKNEPMLFRLTKCSDLLHSRNASGKSIVRPERVNLTLMWSPHFCPLLQGYSYCNGDRTYTLEAVDSDLKTDGKTHQHFLRINHYAFRDENYFYNVRLPRDHLPELILQHYQDYNVTEDYEITQFIKKNYSKKFKQIWKK